MKKQNVWKGAIAIVLFGLCVIPFLYLLVTAAFREGQLSLQAYYEVFLGKTEFLLRFWKSLILSVCIASVQVVLSTLAGYGFAKFHFPGKNILSFIFMCLMILPLQVTLMPNYLILDGMGIMGTYLSLALPAIFVPLGTFIMTQSFRAVPDSMIEAAQLDGCGTLQMIPRIMLPVNSSGFLCVALLSFVDAWNMVEQPLSYLEEFSQYPISVALAAVSPVEPTVLLACCVLVTLPPLFFFVVFNRELSEGMSLGGEK